MTTDLDPTTADGSGQRHQPSRGPAMRAYCATLSRFTSAVQSTEQLLRNDEAGTREDTEQLEITTAGRLRRIERAGAAAEAGLEHTTAVRAVHGLPAPEEPSGSSPGGRDLARRTGGSDVGMALTSLGRRRDELRAAESEFTQWLDGHDEQSRRVVLAATGAVGVVAALAMAVLGTRMSGSASLALLAVCTVAVVTTALTTASARRLRRVCTGPGLSRRPDPVAMARYGGVVAAAAAVGLAAVNIAVGSL